MIFFDRDSVTLHQGDCLEVLKELPAQSVHCCVTSPPYWGLRDYGTDGQLGLETTPEEYVDKLVEIFREVRRVLRDDGTLWLNLGDSYAAGGHGGHNNSATFHGHNERSGDRHPKNPPDGLKPKDLVGIPWRTAFALQADGWYLRQEIIWHKPNPMPESVTDRCTKAHESIFLLSKNQRYYYDQEAIREEAHDSPEKTPAGWDTGHGAHGTIHKSGRTRNPSIAGRDSKGCPNGIYRVRNKRSVWTVSTKPFTGWQQTCRLVRVERDASSDGKKHIVSASCPVHGGLLALLATALCGQREAYLSARTERIGSRLAQAREADFGSIDLIRGYNYDSQSLDWLLRSCSLFATGRNKEIHRMARDLVTTWPCKPSARTLRHIAGTLASRESFEPLLNSYESNIWPDEMDGRLLEGTLTRNADTISWDGSCSCPCYQQITQETSHFATFPPKLIEPCILAGCPEDGNVLDPFLGSGTTAEVAQRLGRRCIGIELNPEYCQLAANRFKQKRLF